MLYPIDHRFSYMELVLPAELFTEQKAYEIAIGQTRTADHMASTTYVRKIHLFNRSFELDPHPCYEAPLQDELTTSEYAIRSRASGRALLFPAAHAEIEQIAYAETIAAKPGETIGINLTLLSSNEPDGKIRGVFIKPLLDGLPLEDEWRVSLRGNRRGANRVDARKTFEVTLPETPGIYTLSTMSWHDPHRLAILPDGRTNEDISTGGHFSDGNLLRFEVIVEEDTPESSDTSDDEEVVEP